jgi:hypothetical protein
MAGPATLLNNAPPTTLGRVEGRSWERYPCDLQTSCQPIAAWADKDCTWPARVRDISAGGVGLVLPRRFEPGAGLIIEIPATASTEADRLLARVVHATALSRGGWLLGCLFPSPLGEDRLRHLLHLANAQNGEGRDVETAGNRLAVQVAREGPQAPANGARLAGKFLIPYVLFETRISRGVVLRLLVRTVRLTGHWPWVEGTVLHVRLRPRHTKSAATKVVVTSCRLQNEQWIVRYSFEGKPSLEVLRSFGHP